MVQDLPDSFVEMGKKLKEEVAKDSLQVYKVQGIEVGKQVAEFFKKNAQLGSDNIGDGGAFFPYLKVGEANSKNELANGKFAVPGKFYFAPTKEQFEDELMVNICNISKGFYLKNEPKEPTEDIRRKRKFVQLVGGVITSSSMPFVMIVSGTRLDYLWQFGKEIKNFTKHPEYPIPMFALKVSLKLKQISTEHGLNYVVDFNLNKNVNGAPLFVADEGQLQMLESSANKLTASYNDYISKFAIDPETLQPLYGGAVQVQTKEEDEGEATSQAVVAEIPF